jgi:hypothetical protein
MGPFERNFRKILTDSCSTTYRIDGTGARIKIPCGAGYREGRNKMGVAILPGHSFKEDETGQMHSIPPCQRLKAGANKKAIPVCPGEPTYEKNGQIIRRKKEVKTESRRASSLELLSGLKKWAKSGHPLKNIFRIS